MGDEKTDDVGAVLRWPNDRAAVPARAVGRAPEPAARLVVNGGSPALRQLSADVAQLADRLGQLERVLAKLRDGVRAGAAVADVLEQLDERLATVEGALEGHSAALAGLTQQPERSVFSATVAEAASRVGSVQGKGWSSPPA